MSKSTFLNFLWEMGEGRVHLLPYGDAIQEYQMKPYKSYGKLRTGFLYQKDGSRFKYIQLSKKEQENYSALSVIHKLQSLYAGGIPIWPESSVDSESFSKILKTDDIEFVFYWMHTFLNGIRGLPIAINHSNGCFYNLSFLFLNLIPEDHLGIFLENVFNAQDIIKKLHNYFDSKEAVWNITMYLSSIRLCSHCGIVSDRNASKKNPWLHYSSNETARLKKERSKLNA